MEIKNGRKLANKRNSFIPTKVRGVRAELSWWEMCENVAEVENTTVNEMIVRVVAEYCQNENKCDIVKEEKNTQKMDFDVYKARVSKYLVRRGMTDKEINTAKNDKVIRACLQKGVPAEKCAEIL